jgi:hypothetical protein
VSGPLRQEAAFNEQPTSQVWRRNLYHDDFFVGFQVMSHLRTWFSL